MKSLNVNTKIFEISMYVIYIAIVVNLIIIELKIAILTAWNCIIQNN